MKAKCVETCDGCPLYPDRCSGDRDRLMSHYIEPPCVYMDDDEDIKNAGIANT